jgi:hypothetical protein
MNLSRLALAALGGFGAYFFVGGVTSAIPALRAEFSKYSTIYRPQQAMMGVMPAGMAAMFVSMIALAAIYAMLYKAGYGLAEGARFGALIGVFAIGAFVFHNYVNLRIGLALTVQQAVAYFVAWTATGAVIGLIYRVPA